MNNFLRIKRFFTKLSNGDFGLSKTFWLYGIIVGLGINILSNILSSFFAPDIFVVPMLLLTHIFYSIPLTVGIWKASRNFEGSKIWVILAKFVSVLIILLLTIGILVVFSLSS